LNFIWGSLKSSYNSRLNEKYIYDESLIVLNKINANNLGVRSGVSTINEVTSVNAGPCRDKAGYAICSGGVIAGAQLAYAGCLGTIFGAPACFALVAVVQAAGIYQCSTSYCDPIQ
jgi:hypothetical protein